MNSCSNYKNIFSILFALSFYFSLHGQNYTSEKKGEVNIIAEPEFYSILNKKLTYDVYNSGYVGYRVQIYWDAGNNSKQGAYNMADEFYKNHQDIPAYITFKEPYYRVRVGDFRSKLDADKLLTNLNKNFKGSFVVKEFISIFDEPYSPTSHWQDSIYVSPKNIHDSESINEDFFR
ncbi:MAG: SPOR domain-containing protein [Bacteroidales bacterium]|jgi:hypothetical protein|nr:SPOR domain-containing protein [Bacteroidales bacterium]